VERSKFREDSIIILLEKLCFSVCYVYLRIGCLSLRRSFYWGSRFEINYISADYDAKRFESSGNKESISENSEFIIKSKSR
jgi:hypothetical protein